jgi:hypothetical protein
MRCVHAEEIARRDEKSLDQTGGGVCLFLTDIARLARDLGPGRIPARAFGLWRRRDDVVVRG